MIANGELYEKVLEKSQELDLLILKEMKKLNYEELKIKKIKSKEIKCEI
jgi:hypothetical protein